MKNNTPKHYKPKQKINCIEITTDNLTSRGGLALFVRYLCGTGIFSYLEERLGGLRRSRKGQEIAEIFKQLFCYFIDGTSRHLTWFDTLKKEPGYAGTIESDQADLLSSHSVKRFFNLMGWAMIFWFRLLLQRLFIWRLKLANPKVIVLGLDTMVMDNDDAVKRHGVKPTYKKEKGFQPLQMTWRRFIIDAVFRGGDKHSNYSDTVEKMVRHVVAIIRKKYREDVPIIIRMDSGFFDQKLFKEFERLEIGYIVAGKFYDDMKTFLSGFLPTEFTKYDNGNEYWDYVEFGDRRGCWDKFRRVVYCKYVQDRNGQKCLEFARPDSVIYTNLGMGGTIDQSLQEAGTAHLTETENIIGSYHSRGGDELVHRALKDFRAEQLPFKRFRPNAAFYYTMLTAFFLYEAFKEDVCAPVVPLGAYAATLRRKVLDIAGKITKHSGRITLNITSAAWNYLKFNELWTRSGSPPLFEWA